MNSANGQMLETCTITLTPVTGADGTVEMQEVTSCVTNPVDGTSAAAASSSTAAAATSTSAAAASSTDSASTDTTAATSTDAAASSTDTVSTFSNVFDGGQAA